jgi:hypothetical protein
MYLLSHMWALYRCYDRWFPNYVLRRNSRAGGTCAKHPATAAARRDARNAAHNSIPEHTCEGEMGEKFVHVRCGVRTHDQLISVQYFGRPRGLREREFERARAGSPREIFKCKKVNTEV